MNAVTSNVGSATLPTHVSQESTPPSSWIGTASSTADQGSSNSNIAQSDLPNMNFQEARLERNAWRGIADSLVKLKAIREVRPILPFEGTGEDDVMIE